MLGAFAVGKTSLVRRYVHSLFSEQYMTTVGVKIDRKLVDQAGQPCALLLWDLYGEDELQRVQLSYLRGSSGLLIVADGTRQRTLDKALELRDKAHGAIGPVPTILVVNKCDLLPQWEIEPAHLDALQGGGLRVIRASAKSGEGVEQAFSTLNALMAQAAGPQTP